MGALLHTKILEFRGELDVLQRQRRDARVAERRGDTVAVAVQDFQPSADVSQLFSHIDATVKKSTHMLLSVPPAPPENSAAVPPVPESPYVESIRQQWQPVLHDMVVIKPEDYLLAMMDRVAVEAQSSEEFKKALGVTTFQKLQATLQALQGGRFSDALTVMKTGLKTDPHNPVLLFMLSQLAYMLVAQGQQTLLPEARDAGQKACIGNESFPLIWSFEIRLRTAMAESVYDPGRAMDLLRNHGLLNTELFEQGEGLLSFNGFGFKAWVLAAQLGSNAWQETDYNQLKQIVQRVVGAAAVYMGLLRPALLAGKGIEIPAPLREIDGLIAGSYGLFISIQKGLADVANNHAPWIIRNRYLRAISGVAALPTFDQTLLHISLDGTSFRADVFPDVALKASLQQNGIPYWRQWALALASDDSVRQPHVLPAADAQEDAHFLTLADNLLEVLRTSERERIQPHIWEDVKPWLVRWQMEHILAAGTGSSKARLRFSPSTMPFSAFYRVWNEPPLGAVLCSEIIYATAGRGGFASFHEVLASFEGAYRLLDDPNHGLYAVQKRALEIAKAEQPENFKGRRVNEQGIDTKRLSVLSMPLLLVGGTVGAFMLGQNLGQSVGIMLAVFGLTGLLAVLISKKK